MGWWNKMVRDKMNDLKFTTAGEVMEQQERYHDYILRKLREEREQESKQKGD